MNNNRCWVLLRKSVIFRDIPQRLPHLALAFNCLISKIHGCLRHCVESRAIGAHTMFIQ